MVGASEGVISPGWALKFPPQIGPGLVQYWYMGSLRESGLNLAETT